MITLKRESGIIIPKSGPCEKYYWLIKQDLTRVNKEYHSDEYVTNTFFYEGEDYLLVPRFFPVEKYFSCRIVDNILDGESIEIDHNIIPRNSLQEKTIDYMVKNNNYIIKLNPGTGKTVMTTYTIAEKKKRTFILIHRDSLVEQWKTEILKFTNLNEYDICRLNSKNFKTAFNNPIIISTTQTFRSILDKHFYEFKQILNNAKIGVLVNDECHSVTGAPKFSDCSLHIPSINTIGLSATPDRNDGNSDIIKYHLGDIYSDNSSEGTMSARVTVLIFNYQIDTPRRFKYMRWGGKFQRSRYLNLTRKSDILVNVCKGLLNTFSKDRDILFISERLNFIDILYQWTPIDSKAKFIAGSSNDDLLNQIVFSTPGKIRDGVNIPQKDCLIVTTPVKNMAQLAGRVIRISDDKKEPIIVDMVDIGCRDMRVTFHNRLNFYKSKNWKVNFIFISDNGEKSILNESDAINLLKGKTFIRGEIINENKKRIYNK